MVGHATATRDAFLLGRNPYPGYRVMFVVDEVPALMAWQRDERYRLLYIALALLMQSLGMQTAKVGMTGLYGSQFTSKEALAEIDFRDACQSQLILRLPTIVASDDVTPGDLKKLAAMLPASPFAKNSPEISGEASGNTFYQPCDPQGLLQSFQMDAETH